ncbi:hypothetical protein GT370_07305 [Acidocella sp. MX-AZ03]|uniref:hypothetical protein n=1 Tax=Acidocella sp. MX-AZ03 TaxID=2697363 RepID=UPI0022DD4133|nr:hypothetical protein [Acidocella sp. MX-AZ03]WBO60570.1 hypothetical protein GT370_07305 [Acidocella sp. MX-AZ03]
MILIIARRRRRRLVNAIDLASRLAGLEADIGEEVIGQHAGCHRLLRLLPFPEITDHGELFAAGIQMHDELLTHQLGQQRLDIDGIEREDAHLQAHRAPLDDAIIPSFAPQAFEELAGIDAQRGVMLIREDARVNTADAGHYASCGAGSGAGGDGRRNTPGAMRFTAPSRMRRAM